MKKIFAVLLIIAIFSTISILAYAQPRHIYSAIKVEPGLVVQLDVSTGEVTGTLSLPRSQAHAIASDGDEDGYIYIGSLGSPVTLYKIKVPELTLVGSLDFGLYTSGAIVHMLYYNGMIYASPSGAGKLVEVDVGSMKVSRTADFPTSSTIMGSAHYSGDIFAMAWIDSVLYIVKIDLSTMQEVDRVAVPVDGVTNVGSREIIVAEDMLYTVLAGFPTRLIEVNPKTMVVTRYMDMVGAKAADRLVYDGEKYLYCNQDQDPAAVSRIDRVSFNYSRLDLLGYGDKGAFDVDLSPDGATLWATIYYSPTGLWVIDTATFTAQQKIDYDNYGPPVQSTMPSSIRDHLNTVTTDIKTTTYTTSLTTTKSSSDNQDFQIDLDLGTVGILVAILLIVIVLYSTIRRKRTEERQSSTPS